MLNKYPLSIVVCGIFGRESSDVIHRLHLCRREEYNVARCERIHIGIHLEYVHIARGNRVGIEVRAISPVEQ